MSVVVMAKYCGDIVVLGCVVGKVGKRLGAKC